MKHSRPLTLICCLAVAIDMLGAGFEPAGRVDEIVREVLAATTVPSASVAIVRDGRVAYLQAYGQARLDPAASATPGMRYKIGSISKQFTAAAILLLAEAGKLSLDDPVAKYVPELTRAGEVKVRQLLSHTAGYQDYWPQDYVPQFMVEAVSPQDIMKRWAGKPLDFDPGTQWQYSNTGYVIAGVVAERAGGQPLFNFLQEHIFKPLGMKSVLNIDQVDLSPDDPTGYTRYGLGPLRPGPREGRGWLFAAGELAMTAEDLAKWDISLIRETLLKPASYREMESAVLLKNGLASNYGLGVAVEKRFGSRCVSHNGAVSGFIAQNLVFPDEQAAVVVLTSCDAAGAAGEIGSRIAPLVLPRQDTSSYEKQAGEVLQGFQKGVIDRALFSPNANAYFTEAALQDLAAGLKAYGPIGSVRQTRQQERGGMTMRGFIAQFPQKRLEVIARILPDGKIEQFWIAPAE